MGLKNKNLLVFSCDSIFFPLLKGAILSLHKVNAIQELFLDIAFVDIGCTDEQLGWLKEQNIEIVSFDSFRDMIDLGDKLVQYNKSQICRPYLPEIFRNYTNIIWCDSDIWFQTIDGIKMYVDLVNDYSEHIVCSPFIDVYYTMNYSTLQGENLLKFIQYFYYWYEGCYNKAVAENLAGRTIFSSGLFAMHRDNPKWQLWKEDLGIVYNNIVINDQNLRHLAEQTAFNKVIYQTGKFIPLEARFNFNCHAGAVERRYKNGNNYMCTSMPPYNIIDVIHLTSTGKFIKKYMQEGFLWDEGRYLTEEERIVLSGICHY